MMGYKPVVKTAGFADTGIKGKEKTRKAGHILEAATPRKRDGRSD